MFEQYTADDRTKHHPNTSHRAPDSHGTSALPLRKSIVDNRQCCRHDKCRTDTHHHARDNKLSSRLCQKPSIQRAERKHSQADLHRQFTTISVADRTSHEQKTGKHQRIDIDHPRQVELTQRQVLCHHRQSHVQAAICQHDAEQRQTQRTQYPPAPRVRLRVNPFKVFRSKCCYRFLSSTFL